MPQAPRSVAPHRPLSVLRLGVVTGCAGRRCIALCGPRTARCRPLSCPAYPPARGSACAIRSHLPLSRLGTPGSS
eukprot:5353154-Lingulodinium_polyedra.AAC.1